VGLSNVAEVAMHLYSSSCSALNALLVPTALQKDEFSEPIWSCWYTEQGPGESGSEFHSTGPATEKARRPNVLRRCRRTINWRWLADLRWWRLWCERWLPGCSCLSHNRTWVWAKRRL